MILTNLPWKSAKVESFEYFAESNQILYANYEDAINEDSIAIAILYKNLRISKSKLDCKKIVALSLLLTRHTGIS
jgi:hypothetical protein